MELSRLDEPFPPEDIEWRVQQCGIAGSGKAWAMVLAYVTNRAIMKRLDDVCGKANWKNEFLPGPDGGVMCGISIRVGDEWIAKWDGAEKTQVEAVKGGMSGSMKRSAVQWGIGRYLYGLEENFAEASAEKRQGWNRASFKDKKTQQFKELWWQPPTLPSWALPPSTPNSGTANTTPSPAARPADDILADFTAQAAECATVADLKGIYKPAWNALASSAEHQQKCVEVFKTRGAELSKAA
ncbi:Rad52/Rad22 family DNA repair protein [Pantoea anthophila]|uniref:Rad52/Rad22 family DNA repair protein n=1 Tax=Pantoea anthophila TaxID=470931 RepID=UPI003CF7609A